jgi:hypothetical protein
LKKNLTLCFGEQLAQFPLEDKIALHQSFDYATTNTERKKWVIWKQPEELASILLPIRFR